MFIIDEQISREELFEKAEVVFDDEMVKAVVDIAKETVGVDAALHSDIEEFMLENGSDNGDLWGINIYLDEEGDDAVEFDSMINMRPWQNNRTRGVDDEAIRERIIEVVNKWIS